jgi:hypothetical protein
MHSTIVCTESTNPTSGEAQSVGEERYKIGIMFSGGLWVVKGGALQGRQQVSSELQRSQCCTLYRLQHSLGTTLDIGDLLVKGFAACDGSPTQI